MLAITSPGAKWPAAEPLPGRHRQPAHTTPARLPRHQAKLTGPSDITAAAAGIFHPGGEHGERLWNGRLTAEFDDVRGSPHDRQLRRAAAWAGAAGIYGAAQGLSAWAAQRAQGRGTRPQFEQFERPAFAPPGAVFPAVWSALNLTTATSAWRVWRAREPEPQAPARREARPASLRTCGMNESVIWSAGCHLPPALNCTVPQAAGPCATASGGPPPQARNVSRNPAAEGRRAGGARSDRGQLEAVDERREPPDDRRAGDRDRRGRTPGVRVQAGQLGDRDHAGGRRHPVGGRPGRLPAHLGVHPDHGLPVACPGHLDHQVPGVQDAGNRRQRERAVPGRRPEIGVSRVKGRGRCACSQARTACGCPGARQKDTSSTSVVETTVVIGTLSASGAFGNRCAPGGTANALRMAASSATARSRGVGDTAVTDPAVVCVAAQLAMAAQAARRSVVPGAHRICGRIPVGRPAGHRGSASGSRLIVSAFPRPTGLVPGAERHGRQRRAPQRPGPARPTPDAHPRGHPNRLSRCERSPPSVSAQSRRSARLTGPQGSPTQACGSGRYARRR